jgi:integrase
MFIGSALWAKTKGKLMARDHGDGSIDSRGKDRWRLRYRIGGKRFTKTVQGSITDAKKELRRLLKSGDDGTHVAPAKMTLGQWIESWLDLRKRSVTARTLERYAEILRLHVSPTLGDKRLQSINATQIDSLYDKLFEKGLSSRTVHHVHTVLGAVFRTAEHKDLIARNPVTRAEPPSVDEEEAGQALEEEQLTALINDFRGRAMFSLVATAAYTGMRRGELLALRWSCFDAEAKSLCIDRAVEETKAHGLRLKEPKTDRGRRTITLDDGLVALLSAEREKALRIVAGVPDGATVNLALVKLPADALIFPAPAPRGAAFDLARLRRPRSVTKEFARNATKLGHPTLRFHDLRVTHETHLLDSGVPVHVVAKRGGHDPAVLLRTYAKRTRKADKGAAAMIGDLSRATLRAS